MSALRLLDLRKHSLPLRIAQEFLRATAALEKVATGFPLHSECVWPGRTTDLFVAHRSVYEFFGRWAKGGRVLDAGCGAGYGSQLLHERGATRVLGVDVDERHVRYARRHFAGPGVEFQVSNCEELDLAPDSFDLVVSSNVIEHLAHPEAFLGAAQRVLSRGGALLLAVPWVVDEETRAHSNAVEFHRSNFTAAEWVELFRRHGWCTRLWVQSFDLERGVPDLFDLRRTCRRVEDFRFVEVEL
jgi:SAM-dependent methyltransferase